MLPQGFVQTSHGTQTNQRDEAINPLPPSSLSERIKLDKSNIILLGPTGCGTYACLYCDEGISVFSIDPH